MKKFEYAIIGAGSAGLSARREIAKKSDNWIVLDDGILGTTCARVGCMPSKVLIQVAEDFYRQHKFNEQGIYVDNIRVNTKEVMQHVRKLRDRFVRGVMGGMKSWGADDKLIRKKAKFIDEHTLDLGDERIHADKIIIGTGSTPIIPDSLKEYSDHLITTDDFFELDDLPQNIVVIGLGVIGIELGQALAKLGINTGLIARRRIIAGVTDPEIREYVCKKFEENFNVSFTGIESITRADSQLIIKTKDKEFTADKILVTAGRKPNLKNLGLENLKLNYDSSGVPEFCNETFSLKDAEHVYLPGDVNGKKPLLHEASDEGKVAGVNALSGNKNPYQMRVPFEVTFSDPNIIKVGKSYLELVTAGIEFEMGEVTFEGQGRSIIKLKEIGLLHIYGNKESGEILGAEGFGPDMEHLGHLISWLMEMKVTVNKALSFPFYHPVIEEGLRTCLRDLREKVNEKKPYLEIFEKGQRP